MKKILFIVATVLGLSACSTTPYEKVYINDGGNYYISETSASNGYYVYEPVMMRYYGFNPWWYDSWFYSPYYAWYGHGWPYYDPRLYRPRYPHGFAYHRGWGYGGYAFWPIYVHRPAAGMVPDAKPDEKGNLPSPLRPVTMRPGMERVLDAAEREHKLMNRGRMAYGSRWLEQPASRDLVLGKSAAGSYKLTQKPIRIDSRKLPRSRPAGWGDYGSNRGFSSRRVQSRRIERFAAYPERTRIPRQHQDISPHRSTGRPLISIHGGA